MDPYDVMGHPILLNLSKSATEGKISRTTWDRVQSSVRNHPLAVRRLLGVRPSVNAKGVGLLLTSWLRAEQFLRAEDAERQVSHAVRWLLTNQSEFPVGVSWGYPFDWQSRIFIPKGTPSSVVTATCAEALLDYAELTGDDRAASAALGAAKFLAEGLNRRRLRGTQHASATLRSILFIATAP